MAEKKVKDLTKLFVTSVNRCRPTKEGSGTFEFTMSEDDIFGDVKYVLLTGNEPFDTFTGGFPFGRISEVYGVENCGKSALMIRAMCRFQAKHIYEVTEKKGFVYTLKRVEPKKLRLIKAYIDNEGSLERGFKLGIHDVTYNEKGEEIVEEIMMDKTGIGLCDTIDQVFLAIQRFLSIISEAEKENEDEENDEVIFGIFIVDTVAGTSSKDEMARDWGERDFPRAAQQISEGFRKLRAEISRHHVALICTNQVRTKFNQQAPGMRKVHYSTPQDTDFSTFGGKALAFYATHRIFMFQVATKYVLVKGSQFAAGYLIGLRTIKNRIRRPAREARMVLLTDPDQGGLHNVLSILETLAFLKVAEIGEDGSVKFLFRKFGVATTTFAENVTFDQEKEEDSKTKSRSRKKLNDPEIEGRWQWIGFYRAHRLDIEKLWQAAVDKANVTEGLDEYYTPEIAANVNGEDNDSEAETSSPLRRPGRGTLRDQVPVATAELTDQDNV